MFSKPLYEDKPDRAECEEEPELTPEEIEREEENEYLASISNFHWFVYPFFKCVERIFDKLFGCKKYALEERQAALDKRQSERMKDERQKAKLE
jgi:hypothetical protein